MSQYVYPGFLLPPESGEKVSLEVTVLLSQAVFLLVISDFLPPSAQNFPILGKYRVVFCMHKWYLIVNNLFWDFKENIKASIRFTITGYL